MGAKKTKSFIFFQMFHLKKIIKEPKRENKKQGYQSDLKQIKCNIIFFSIRQFFNM